jgi:biotin-dependent carboxylase-like uncharacterized protein
MIKVLKPGIYTTIQDLGRFGYRNQGVPVSGFMDSISAGFANALLNNNANDALIEITLSGPKLLFTELTNIVLTGAEMSPLLNDEPIQNYRVYKVVDGDILSFGELKRGLRCYLAVHGGLDSEIVLNSKSYYEDLTSQYCLKKNDVLSYKSGVKEVEKHESNIKIMSQFYDTDNLEVYMGPDFELFTSKEQERILTGCYTVSKDNNRMGYQLEEISVVHTKSIITSPVLPGTVQLTPSGKLIVLLKDAQTTGGYPRVLQLTEKSVSILAQKNIGDKLYFDLVALED